MDIWTAKWRWVLGVVLALVIAGPAAADYGSYGSMPPILDTVRVVGRPGSDTVSCRGASCTQALDFLRMNATLTPPLLYAEIGADETFDYSAFCSALRSKGPGGCSTSWPPSTPGLDPNWRPNGCGSGGLANVIADAALRAQGANYSGDLNAPYRGISFLVACNEHDRCWGAGGTKDVCDGAFLNNMQSACYAAGSDGECLGYASAYHAAVTITETSKSTYAAATNARKCAVWAHDMNSNGCKQ